MKTNIWKQPPMKKNPFQKEIPAKGETLKEMRENVERHERHERHEMEEVRLEKGKWGRERHDDLISPPRRRYR